MRTFGAFCVGLLSLVSAAVAPAAEFRSYHIGNSLTGQLINAGKLSSFSTVSGQQHTTGYHIRSSAPLNYMWANPGDNSGVDPATLNHALPEQQWNAVTLQPYVTSFASIASTLGTDTQVINDAMALTRTNPLNSGTRFFIYAAWPAADLGTYETAWSRPATADNSQLTMLARAYFDKLYQAVSAQHPDVRMIPAGETLFRVDQRIRSGEIPGLTSISQLYGDTYHLNDLGCHVIAAAAYATMFSASPVGQPYSSATSPASPETIRALQETAWGVVTSHSYTGVPEPTSVAGILGGSMLLLRRRP